MRQPDITGTEGFAQMEQDRDLPYPVLIFAIQVAVPLRGAAQKGQRPDVWCRRARDDRACRQQRLRHGRGTDVEYPQHARRITPEAMISVTDMRQRISGKRVGQLSGRGDKPLEGYPAAGIADGLFERGPILMRFQERRSQCPEGLQGVLQRRSGIVHPGVTS